MRDGPLVDKAAGLAMIIWAAMILGMILYVTR